MALKQITVAATSRAYPGESVNGDAWRVDQDRDRCRIAVIDGLGHGPNAATAANAALGLLAANPDLDPTSALERCHHELRGTRGVAMGVVLLDKGSCRLTFAGVGNVEARLWHPGREQRFSSARGIVGSVLPTIRPDELNIGDKWRLVIHTDGVSARFSFTELLGDELPLQQISDAILTNWGRATDDATVVVAGMDCVGH
jgi:serine phosphatase RsbU (regulator of sigma subunit)